MQKLSKNFFMQNAAWVAENLLGHTLVRITESGITLKGKIVETEAYLGAKDSCCHSFGHRYTNRTKVMYLTGGYIYVYFTYGMHHCFNIVTTQHEPEAVLIRAIEPLIGISTMKKYRTAFKEKKLTLTQLANGPGKLCQAMQITKKLNGTRLGSAIDIKKTSTIKKVQIGISTRIGLSSKQTACYWPLRFFIKDSPFVSKHLHY